MEDCEYTITMFVLEEDSKTVNVFEYDIKKLEHIHRDTVICTMPMLETFKVFKNSKFYILLGTNEFSYKYNYHTKTLEHIPSSVFNCTSHLVMYKDHFIIDNGRNMKIYDVDLNFVSEHNYMGFLLYNNRMYTTEVADEDLKLNLIELSFAPFTASVVEVPEIETSYDPDFGECIEVLTSNPCYILRERNQFYFSGTYSSQPGYIRIVEYLTHVRIVKSGELYFATRGYDLQLRKMKDNEIIFSLSGSKGTHWIVET